MVATNYTSTGIAGLTGGYAYPPGSTMTQFLDSVNNTAAAAMVGPNGQDVVSWANGLAQQQQARKMAQAQAGLTGSAGTAANSSNELISQIFNTMMFILSNLNKEEA